MTKDEAKAILEKSDDLASITDEHGVTYHSQVSDLFREYPDYFAFAVYSYSSKKPLDTKHAFMYYVDKMTGEIDSGSAPMVEIEFQMLGDKINGFNRG